MFSSTNQALAFGLKATPKQMRTIERNHSRYKKLFQVKMESGKRKTDAVMNRLFLIASKIQFCQEALDAKKISDRMT